ncbi:hypothetical protein ABN584_17390 [Gloeocapsa sp. BRSZ]
MNIENLSFLTELTDEDASRVNGGLDFTVGSTPISIRRRFPLLFPVIPKRPVWDFIKLL